MTNSSITAIHEPVRHKEYKSAVQSLPLRCHTAIHLLYDTKLHAVQLQTLSEIRVILEKIGDILVRNGMQLSGPSDIIEIQARVTLSEHTTLHCPTNSDRTDTSGSDPAKDPRRFGYL